MKTIQKRFSLLTYGGHGDEKLKMKPRTLVTSLSALSLVRTTDEDAGAPAAAATAAGCYTCYNVACCTRS